MSDFETAYANAGKLLGGTDADKLEFYSLAKIANGEDINAAPKPGTFDFTGKAKRSAWQKKVDEGITAEEAKKQYVERFNALKEKYGLKE
ncbi:uncharacterized protein PV09_03135 [Verruconis gallopava]|uniref:ACB domain-containing protein n=1 Tax=Verruconis gallopava TaxID=253628 RepID=A0A0D1XTB0_9PEZI|nr:uncharacterized protein PV09_03135 [Verruconis gallopava]KIW05946.1 hypothetical protein PV09_03135 [Verruconis gallopava]